MISSYVEFVLLCVIILLPICYETSSKFRYSFKFFVYYGVVMLNSVILLPIMVLRPCNVWNLVLASKFCKIVSIAIGIKWEVRGGEHLNVDRAAVIVANHQSSLDILGMFDFWHIMEKCTVIAKRELFYAWPFGLAAWLSGLIFIDRRHAEKSQATMNDSTRMLIEKKVKLWVFPEGTRRITNEIHPFKKGAFHVAVRAQLPILPVVYSSYHTFLNNRSKVMNNGHVIVTALPPIETKGLTIDDIPALIERTRNVMSDTFKATTKEVENRFNLSGNGNGLTGPKLPQHKSIDDMASVSPSGKIGSLIGTNDSSPIKQPVAYRRKDVQRD